MLCLFLHWPGHLILELVHEDFQIHSKVVFCLLIFLCLFKRKTKVITFIFRRRFVSAFCPLLDVDDGEDSND